LTLALIYAGNYTGWYAEESKKHAVDKVVLSIIITTSWCLFLFAASKQ
jgi:hypothetical protein